MPRRSSALIGVAFFLAVLASGAWAGDDSAGLREESQRLLQRGEYAEAGRLADQAVVFSEHHYGGADLDTAESLLSAATAARGLGEYARALVLAERALAIEEQQHGGDDPDTARALHAAAEARRLQGDYAGAAPLAERALAIREKTKGAGAPETAESLHSLSEIRRGAGEYAKALPLAQRALSIREKATGATSAETAESLNDLGVVYAGMADATQALPLYRRALAAREQTLGPDHPLTAETVNNLAALYWSQKDLAAARPLFERALAIKEHALGPDHPSTATALNNLAELYRSMGDDEKARPLMERALVIWEKALGPDHPYVATALSNLAGFDWSAGRYRQAQPRFERAEAIWERTLGPEHPDTARALNILAAFHQSTGDYAKALALYQRGLAAEDRVFASVFAVASEEQKLRFVEKSQGHYIAALSLIQAHFAKDPEAVRFGLELVLRRKGVVLDAQARTQEAVAGHLKGETLQAWQRLGRARGDLAKVLLAGPGTQDPEAYRKSVEELQDAITREEEFLSARSGVVAQELAQRQATAALVAAQLPRDAALAEFVVVRDWDEQHLTWTDHSRYLVFILTPDSRVELIDLGPAALLEAQLLALRQSINDPDFLKHLTEYTHASDAQLTAAYRAVLAPVVSAASGVHQWVISPDGELHTIPFAALRTEAGRYFVEDHTLSYVASGRDLVRPDSGVTPAVGLLLVANPAFDDAKANKASPQGPVAVRAINFRGAFSQLPGTAEEAQVIPPLVSGARKVLTGHDASESAVRAVHSPHVLHFATHGFFLPENPGDDALPDVLGRRGRFRGGDASPLVRSGLALAGANFASTVGRGDDGILTALEVTGLDLYGTELVVLSACETALGEVKTGEGVFGLRRAFALAGARNLVMSLWPVNDKVTREQMERFYQDYGNGQSPAAALRAAQLATIATLREKTKSSKEGEPIAPVNIWGPFIVQQSGRVAAEQP